MILIALALAIAGIVQAYFQRVLGMDYLTTQGFMKLWYAVFWVSAWGFVAGVALFLTDFFTLARAEKETARASLKFTVNNGSRRV